MLRISLRCTRVAPVGFFRRETIRGCRRIGNSNRQPLVDERSSECSDAALFQVSHAAVHGVKRETGAFVSNKSGAAPATVGA